MFKNLTLNEQPRPPGPTNGRLSPKSVRKWGFCLLQWADSPFPCFKNNSKAATNCHECYLKQRMLSQTVSASYTWPCFDLDLHQNPLHLKDQRKPPCVPLLTLHDLRLDPLFCKRCYKSLVVVFLVQRVQASKVPPSEFCLSACLRRFGL